jgi:hypothetical protein
MNEAHGQSVAMMVVTFFGTIWWLLALRFSKFTTLRVMAILVGVVILVLAAVYCGHRPSDATGSRGDPEPDWRSFTIVVAVEWIAIIVAVVVPRLLKRRDLIISLIALIVGLHFLPLVGVFSMREFYLPAAGMTVAALAGFAFRETRYRQAFTCAGCGATLWLCAMLIWLTA